MPSSVAKILHTPVLELGLAWLAVQCQLTGQCTHWLAGGGQSMIIAQLSIASNLQTDFFVFWSWPVEC